MTDEIKTDVTKALADIKAETAKLETDAKADMTKIKSVWQSYQIYIVAFICLVFGAVAGHILK